MRMARILAPILLITVSTQSQAADGDAGPFTRALWLIQRYGTPTVNAPANDAKLKGALFKALGKDGVLHAESAAPFLSAATFARLAGSDGRLTPVEVRQALEADMPASRQRLLPAVAAHAALLSTSFDLIDERHREAASNLAEWLAAHHKPGQPLHVSVICTGNSRRSVMGATMGNIAAAYYGMPEVRFHSGGTAPTAVNPRAIVALRAMGVAIEPTGAEAPRGEPKTANPIYRVRWGESGLEMTEFSKLYADSSNTQQGFAALLVCGEADEACPHVKGASIRISMPFLDPKIFDESTFESQKYTERRDDIGRVLLCALMQARNRLGEGSIDGAR
jgi:arsenate reductase (thioredoxin)